MSNTTDIHYEIDDRFEKTDCPYCKYKHWKPVGFRTGCPHCHQLEPIKEVDKK